MRACFLGQNTCALGFGVATLQTPPLVLEEAQPQGETESKPPQAVDNNKAPRTLMPRLTLRLRHLS